MKHILPTIFAVAVAGLSSQVKAQVPDMTPMEAPAEAPEGAVAISIYGSANPGSPKDEIATTFMGRETVLRNITYPTLTPVLPDPAKANGTAVIVAPGGAFQMLSLQNEGWRIARKLADNGVAAFVLKYRLLPTPRDDAEFLKNMSRLFQNIDQNRGKRPEISNPAATQDSLAALKLIRANASRWHVNPDRVGMIGFSAGAMATMKTVLEAGIDDDPQTRAPDFIGYIYGPMTKVDVPADAPPMFAALAMDDTLFGNGDFSVASAWHAAKRPVELHVYQAGGHGFGMGKPGTTSMMVMDEFLAWMDMQGLLTAKTDP